MAQGINIRFDDDAYKKVRQQLSTLLKDLDKATSKKYDINLTSLGMNEILNGVDKINKVLDKLGADAIRSLSQAGEQAGRNFSHGMARGAEQGSKQISDIILNQQNKIDKVLARVHELSSYSGMSNYNELTSQIDRIVEKGMRVQNVALQIDNELNKITHANISYMNSVGKRLNHNLVVDDKDGLVKTSGITVSQNTNKLHGDLDKASKELDKFKTKFESIKNVDENLKKNGLTSIDLLKKKLESIRGDLNKGFAPNEKEMNIFRGQFGDIQKQVLHVESIEKATKQAALAADKGKIAFDKMSNTLFNLENNKKIAFNVSDLNNFKNAMESLKDGTITDVKAMETQIKTLNNQLDRLKVEGMSNGINTNQHHGKSLLSTVGDKFQEFGIYSGVASGYYLAFQSMRNGIQDVADLDAALTELRMTLDGTEEQYQQMSKVAQEDAIAMGTDINTVLKVIRVYGNLTESLDSVQQKIKSTIAVVNLSGLDAYEVTDIMQGIQEQFSLTGDTISEVSDRIADSISTVSANLAVDFAKGMKEISNGIAVSGSVAKEAGFSLEQYEGLLGAVIERTRMSGDVIGNAYKTIFSRLNKVSNPDGTEEDRLAYSKAVTAYKDVGIDLVDSDTGNFRNTATVLGELSQKWSTLTNVQKNYIAFQSAGARQANIFIATMESYNRTLELTAKAENSKGSAMAMNEKYLDSIQGKWKRLNSEISKFWQDLIDSSTVKTIVGVLGDMVSALDTINNHLGFFGTTLAVGGGVALESFLFSLRKNVKEFGSLSNALDNLNKGSGKGFAQTITNWNNKMRGFNDESSVKGDMFSNNALLKAKQLITANKELEKVKETMTTTDAAQIAQNQATIDLLNMEMATRGSGVAVIQESIANKVALIETNELEIVEIQRRIEMLELDALGNKALINEERKLIAAREANIIAIDEEITAMQAQLGVIAEVEVAGAGMAAGAGFLTAGLALIPLLIGGIAFSMSDLGDSTKKTVDEINKISTKSKEAYESLNKVKSLLNQKNEIDSSGTGNTSNLPTEQRQRLLEIEKQIAESLPKATSEYDSQGTAIASNTKKIEEQIDAQEKLNKATAIGNLGKIKKDFDIKKVIEDYNDGQINQKNIIGKFDNKDEIKRIAKENLIKYNANADSYNANMAEQGIDAHMKHSTLDEEISKIEASYGKSLEKQSKKLADEKKILDASIQIVKEFVDNAGGSTDPEKVFGKNVTEEDKALLKYYLDQQKGSKDAKESTDLWGKSIQGIGQNFKKLGKEFVSDIADVDKAIEDSTSSISELQGYLEEIDNGGITGKSVTDMISKYPQLIKYLDDEQELRKQIESQIKSEEDIVRQSVVNKLLLDEGYYNNISQLENQKLKSMAEAYSADLSKAKSLAAAKVALEAGIINKVNSMYSSNWRNYYGINPVTGQAVVDGTNYTGNKAGQISFNSGVTKYKSAADMYNVAIGDINGFFDGIVSGAASSLAKSVNFSGKSSSGDSSKDRANQIADQYEDSLDAIKSRQHVASNNLSIAKTYAEKQKYQQEEIAYAEQYANALQTAVSGLTSQLYGLKQNSDEWNAVNEKIKSYKDNLSDATTEIVKQRDAMESLREEEEKASQSLLDKILNAIKTRDSAKGDKSTLNALKKEREAWANDNSELGKSKIKQLDSQISKMELSDKQYAEAMSILVGGNETEITNLLLSNDATYKSIGTQLGTSLGNAMADAYKKILQKEIKNGLDAAKTLVTPSPIPEESPITPTTYSEPSYSPAPVSPSSSTTDYFPRVSYSGGSIVDALKSIGVASDFETRKKIAIKNGISNYSGTGSQNVSLLNLLKQGNLARFFSGGNTGDWIGDEGKLSILDKKERVLNQPQTKAFEKLVYDILPNFNNNIMLNGFGKTSPTNMFNAPVVQNEITINNSTPFDVNNNMDNLNNAIKQQLRVSGYRLNLV